MLELTLSDASGPACREQRASARRRSPCRSTWPNAAYYRGRGAEPPRWDDARATATLTLAVPVLSLRNELLGALTAVLDLGDRQDALAGHHAVVTRRGDPAACRGRRAAAQHTVRDHRTDVARSRSTVVGCAARPGEPMLVERSSSARSHRGGRYASSAAGRSSSRKGNAPRSSRRGSSCSKLFLLLVTGLTLLVGVVAYWMGRSIVTPLNSLITAADASPAAN